MNKSKVSKLIRSCKRLLSKSSLIFLTDNVYIVFSCYYVTKTLINLTLQCAYVVLEQEYNQTVDIESRLKTKNKMTYILDLMIISGQFLRGSNTSGIYYYSINFFTGIVYIVMKKAFRNNFFCYDKERGFVLSLTNPSSEYSKIERKVIYYIYRSRESNKNYTRIIFNNQSISNNSYTCKNVLNDAQNFNTKNDNFMRYSVFERKELNFRKKQTITTTTSRSLTILNDNNHQNINNQNDDKELLSQNKFLSGLTEQLKHLSRLIADKRKIWPINRNIQSSNEIKQYFVKLYQTVLYTDYVMAHTWAGYLIHYCHISLINGNLDEKYRKFTFSDRLAAAELHMWFTFAAELFLTPVLLTITCIKDQMKFINLLKSRAREIFKGIERIEDLEDNFKFIEQQQQQREINELRNDLNEKTMELYINHLLFCEDAKMSAKLATNVINEVITFMILATIPVSFFYQEIPADQKALFFTLSIGLFIAINVVLCTCAQSLALCAKISRVAWLIIALIERYNLRKYYKSIGIKDDGFGQNKRDYHNFKKTTNQNNNQSNVDFEYYSNCLVNPHTILLWRNLAKYNHVINDGFACRLFNTFKIDFAGILRLNHWAVSLMLFVATYYHHN